MSIIATNDSNEAKNLAVSLGLTNFKIRKYVRTFYYQANAQWSWPNMFFYGRIQWTSLSNGDFDGSFRFLNDGNVGNELINSLSNDVMLFPQGLYEVDQVYLQRPVAKIVCDGFEFVQGTAGHEVRFYLFFDGYTIEYN